MGAVSQDGFLAFFPVVLGLKTPVPFLLFTLAGAALALSARGRYRGACIPLFFAAATVAVGMVGRIDIGIRHILPVYIGMAPVAAAGLSYLFEFSRTRRWAGVAVVGLVAWFAAGSLMSHPDYIPYFNFLAGEHPEDITVDSNLDWGQDMKRLSARLREVGAKEVSFSQFFYGDLEREHGFPPIHDMDPLRPSPGWNAVNLTTLKLTRLGLWDQYPNLQVWPNYTAPTERVGHGILLWYFPYPNEVTDCRPPANSPLKTTSADTCPPRAPKPVRPGAG
jgi:hypothetical protein